MAITILLDQKGHCDLSTTLSVLFNDFGKNGFTRHLIFACGQDYLCVIVCACVCARACTSAETIEEATLP